MANERKETDSEKLKRLRDSKDLMELELLEESVLTLQARKRRARQSHAAVEKLLEERRRGEYWRHGQCTHKKGGEGVAALHKGGDGVPSYQYCVITHHYAHEEAPTVICQRCAFEWYKGTTEKRLRLKPGALHFSDGSANPTKTSWETAMGWPTRSRPSGSITFRFPEQREPERQQELVEA